ncbi:DUF4388 domain-containing protein [bacterium]|nr:DUF4388 domain-containing protein [bacterium]
MALEGTLKDFSLADIFQLIGLQRKTGILTLQSEIDTVTVTFLDGKIVGAESVEKKLEDRLGRVLVKRGYISNEQLEEALAMQRETLQRLGYILIKNNVLSQEELKKALQDQINQILFRLFRWKEGYYHFRQEKTVHFDKENITPISAENILMAGVQIVDEWPRIEERIPNMELVFRKKAVPPGFKIITKHEEEESDFTLLEEAVDEADHVPEKESTDLDSVITLSREEEMAYALVDGDRTVQAIVDACHQGEFETLKAIYSLLELQLIELDQSELPEKYEEIGEKDRFEFIKKNVGFIVVLGVLAVAFVFLPFNPLGAVKGLFDNLSLFFHPRVQSNPAVFEEFNRLKFDRIQYALKIFYLNNRSFPSSLDRLVNDKYLTQQDILDVWGNAFDLSSSDLDNEIRSAGPDGIMHTPDDISVKEILIDNLNESVFFPHDLKQG